VLPFFQPILGFLDYKLPIFNKGDLKHFGLEIFEQLALNLLKDSPDWFSIMYKLMDVLI
jgi:hypothetical protein